MKQVIYGLADSIIANDLQWPSKLAELFQTFLPPISLKLYQILANALTDKQEIIAYVGSQYVAYCM